MASEKVVYESVPKNEKDGALLESSQPERPKGFGARHLQALILFMCITITFTMKSQLSVLMVAMVEKTDPITCNSTEVCLQNETAVNSSAHSWTVFRKYDWNKSTQEMITFSFFAGYTVMMLPSGILAQKYGGKLPIMVALGVNGVLTVLTPWIPLIGGWIGLCLSRLLQGMTQAALFPSVHTILGKWAPPSERGRLSTYIYSGPQFGTILAFQLSGVFAGNPILGWPTSFWFFGSISLICCVLVALYGSSTPFEHKNITPEELAYIIYGSNSDASTKNRKTPWKEILTSTAVWGMICAHTGTVIGYLLILTEIPIYMGNVLKVDIQNNGIFSSLPFVSMYFFTIFFGYAADFFANRKLMSIVNIRRTGSSIGLVLSGVFIIAFSYVGDTILAIVMLVISLALYSGVFIGFQLNQIDLSPNFAGSLMAVSNMTGNLVALLLPVVVSTIVKDDVGDQGKWRIVFYIFVAIEFALNAVFVIFVKGDVQPWNFYGDEDEDIEKELKEFEEKHPSEKIYEEKCEKDTERTQSILKS